MGKIICPVCGSFQIGFYISKNNYSLYKCADCTLVFVYPIPSKLNEIYDEEYFLKKKKGENNFGYTDYEKDKKPMKDVFIDYLEQLEKLTTDRNILDIGAATGYFLDLARNRGWETAGIEISSYAAEIARNKGHKIFKETPPNVKIGEKFGVITMWDVLEHLDEPQKYLKAINSILKEGGLLAINTIDKESWWARFWDKKWHSIIPPEHLFYYSRKNLDILLGKNGFKILKTKKIGKKFSLSYIFNILFNWQKLEIWNKLADYCDKKFWRKFEIPLNLKDNIFIIAKKIKEI